MEVTYAFSPLLYIWHTSSGIWTRFLRERIVLFILCEESAFSHWGKFISENKWRQYGDSKAHARDKVDETQAAQHCSNQSLQTH